MSESQSDIPAPDGPLQTPVQFVPGVGPDRAQLLNRIGIETAYDLLMHVPHSVNDFTDLRPAHKLEKDVEQSVHGRVVDTELRRLSGGRTLVGILLDCNGHFVRGTWFNQPWMLKKFRDHDHVIFSGKPQRKSGRWEFGNPRVHWLEHDDTDDDVEGAIGVLPRYRLTDGIKMDAMRRMTKAAVERFAHLVTDPLPDYFRRHFQLPALPETFRQLHAPESREEFDAARHRLILDDLLEFQLGLALRRRFWGTESVAPALAVSARIDARIRRLFEFRFTKGQDNVIREIVNDLSQTRPMHRLLQADVGAGKTAVAVYAILAAVAAGHQAVLMAPTEVLATQHWQTFEELLAQSRVRRGLLIGGLSAPHRRELLADLRSGHCQLLIGTQAVIQDSVRFNSLAVAVIDEQHRFGVRQRAAFATSPKESKESENTTSPIQQPHVLVMTATPIPRSLCLTRFGDLDISTIKELPPGRQKVVTSRIDSDAHQQRVWAFVRKQVSAGRQAYVVCPRVEGQTEADDAAAETVFRTLQKTQLSELKLGLLHGRMDRDQRRRVMDQFRFQELDVLVSTTVIEVGVNVPNATIMVIQQADRFGLAQLHQLRGRICRGSYQGYCFLFAGEVTPEANDRLQAMEESADGFQLAEKDAELRGPGDVLGTRQSGDLPLRVADPVRDMKTLREARQMAFDLVRTGDFDTAEFTGLKQLVIQRFSNILNLPHTG